jgi:hypothetical protein
MSSISAGTTLNTGLVYTADSSGTLQIQTGAGAVTAINVDAVQNVGIGITPALRFHVAGAGVSNPAGGTGAYLNSLIYDTTPGGLQGVGGAIGLQGNDGVNSGVIFAVINGAKENATSGNYASYVSFSTRANAGNIVEGARLDSGSNLKFNSGYGSVAVAYGVRAWANHQAGSNTFNGKGNFSSVTKNSTGNFTYSFATAMPDSTYAVQVNSWQSVSTVSVDFNIYSLTTSNFVVVYYENSIATNPVTGYITVVR